MHAHPNSDRVMGTYIHWVLLFAWVIQKFDSLIGTYMYMYIHWVLVIDGYLHSRVYSKSETPQTQEAIMKFKS